jgi:hypothetical protein
MRLVTVLVVAALLAAACGGGTSPSNAAGATRHVQPGTSAPAAVRGQGTPPGSGSVPSAAVATSAADPSAARAALDAYLAALVHLDRTAASNAALDGPATYVSIQALVAAYNAEQGGQTTLALSRETFTPTHVDADTATFSGSVTITNLISGPKGRSGSTDTISGPVQLLRSSGAWKVSTFTLDGAALLYFPEQARQVVNGVELDVGSVLSYGAQTTALVGVGSQTGHQDIKLLSTQLVTNGAAAGGHGFFVNTARVSGFFVYPRAPGTPHALDAAFTTGIGSTVTFSVGLPGQAS